MNPRITYIIVDLPELLSLQYVYLGSLEGTEELNIISSDDDVVEIGKINLVSSEFLLTDKFDLICDTFISTWALTECPDYIQSFVCQKSFFSAKNVFLASRIDSNNHLRNLDFIKIPVPDLQGDHEYWVSKILYH
jgi:hypothetical protein